MKISLNWEDHLYILEQIYLDKLMQDLYKKLKQVEKY